MSEHVTDGEPYLRLEEVAERLGLPLSVLLHRVEAGDIPAKRVETSDGVHYALRLGDLGIELDDDGLHSSAIREEAEGEEESTLTAVFQQDEAATSVRSAIASAFNSGREPLPGDQANTPDATSRRLEEDDAADALDSTEQQPWADPDAIEPWRESDAIAPAWTTRPREPQEPPVWLSDVPPATPDGVGRSPDDGLDDVDDAGDVYAPPVSGTDRDVVPGFAHPSLDAQPADDLAFDEDTVVTEMAVPPPPRGAQYGIVEAGIPGPRGDLAAMSLDARELVAGLLDRWERTLEQRIYTEQRQRFQAELVSRQNMVKQLQMELHTARAEHAAAQSEKDRILAEKERELADRERDLAESRRAAADAQRLTEREADAAPAAEAAPRRRWFWSRDD